MILAHDVVDEIPKNDSAGTVPILLLHSTVCDRRMWDQQMNTIAVAGYRAIRCDLSGYGETPASSSPYSDADDVLALMDDLGVEQASLIGASGGGLVATEVAARWPERVPNLLLVSTAAADHEPSPELAAFAAEEEELLEAGKIERAVELNLNTWVRSDVPNRTRELVGQMQRRAFELQLAMDDVEELEAAVDPSRIAARTLLVSGARDFEDFRRIAEDLTARIPSAEHRHLDWAGHLPTLEHPEEMDQLIMDFLA